MNNEELNKWFNDAFFKNYGEASIDDPVYRRKSYLNARTVFGEEELSKLRKINATLRAEEQRVREYMKHYYPLLDGLVMRNKMSGYSLAFTLKCFNDSGYYAEINPEFEGDFFWKVPLYCFGKQDLDDDIYSQNWNGTYYPEVLAEEFFCYTLHCLISLTPLAFEDIMRIDSTCIDVEVVKRFAIETKPTKSEATDIVPSRNKLYDKTLEDHFLFQDVTKWEDQLISKRRTYLDGQFKFTERNMARLKDINEELSKVEEQIEGCFSQFYPQLRNDSSAGIIDDFYQGSAVISFTPEHFSKKPLTNNIEKHQWSFKTELYISEKGIRDDDYLAERGHIRFFPKEINDKSFCFTLYQIYSQSPLSLADIVGLQAIQIAITTTVQFLRNIDHPAEHNKA